MGQLPIWWNHCSNVLPRLVHNMADLTLVTSPQLHSHMLAIGVKSVDIWQKGINIQVSFVVCFCFLVANCSYS